MPPEIGRWSPQRTWHDPVTEAEWAELAASGRSAFGRENAVSDIHPNKIRERCWARDVKAHPKRGDSFSWQFSQRGHEGACGFL